MRSLRRDLLLYVLGSVVAAFLFGGAATYYMARAEVDEVMDYHLRQFALSLRDQRFGEPITPPAGVPEEALDIVIQIWDSRGLKLYLSNPHSQLPSTAQLGYSDAVTDEGRWRIFAVALRDRVVQVAQPMRVRSRVAASAAVRTLFPLFLMLPLLGGMIWYMVGRGLRPLDRLARGVAQRRPDALSPLPGEGVPSEARPLVDALNELLGRLDRALANQRAFVADAAHELRTPLTALQLQLQLTERASDEAERKEALLELRRGLQRSIHLVGQLLTLARQEPDSEGGMTPVSVDLADLVGQALADHAAIADQRQIDLGADERAAGTRVEGDAGALRTLVGNLIDNAIRYTPAGGRVDVNVRRHDGVPVIEVADTGPGIPPAERARVFDRFYRRAGESQPGSGLGLAIVKAIADRHGARVELDAAPAGGLLVRVVFPAAGAH
ncbi:MAG: sensor histidine kinase N-terminal domain-containing protein [Rhodocyclaceae bacterium]|nr:sensor histidine kinase N-terminal domain-containing protein [Rhodocyclaceae bacterium]